MWFAYIERYNSSNLNGCIRDNVNVVENSHPKTRLKYMSLQVQIISDVHIEKEGYDILHYLVPSARTLFIAGDVGQISDDKRWADYIRFMGSASRAFGAVYFVAGNHEYYTSGTEKWTMNDVSIKLGSIPMMYPNIQWLDNVTTDIHGFGVRLFGSTYWSHIPYEFEIGTTYPMLVSRNRYISTSKYNKLHAEARSKLEDALVNRSASSKFCVLTHHVPTFANTLKPEHGGKEDVKNHLYCSESNVYLDTRFISTWVCGHTHYNFDFNVAGCRVVSNQVAAPGFDPKMVVML